jgi:hypothetical protein
MLERGLQSQKERGVSWERGPFLGRCILGWGELTQVYSHHAGHIPLSEADNAKSLMVAVDLLLEWTSCLKKTWFFVCAKSQEPRPFFFPFPFFFLLRG